MIKRPLVEPSSTWTPTPVSELPAWPVHGRVSVDVETREPSDFGKNGTGLRRTDDAYVVGVSFAIEDGGAYYLPIAHEGGGNLDPKHVWRYLQDQADRFQGTIVGANLQYDLDWLAANDVVFAAAKWFKDVQVADPVIYELHHSYTLEAVLGRWGVPGKDESHLREAARAWGFSASVKGNLWRLPASHVGAYAEQDAVGPLLALRRQEREIEEKELWSVWEMECRVLPILLGMRQKGVLIDQDQLAHVEAWSLAEARKELEVVRYHTGRRIDPDELGDKGALLPALEEAGFSRSRFSLTAGGAKRLAAGLELRPVDYEVTAEALRLIDHPVADAILAAKKADKLRRTFCASIRRFLGADGRVHATFNQLKRQDDGSDLDGTITGRLSLKAPNLHQQPRRGEIGAMWRRIYVPEPGALWGKLDYSSQEPRIMVHAGVAQGLRGAAEFARRYREEPDTTDFHDMVTALARAGGADVTRDQCKIAGLARAYGAGLGKLAMQLGLPYAEETQADGRVFLVPVGLATEGIVNAIDAAVPFLSELQRLAKAVAARKGYITTAGGRRLHFPSKGAGNGYDFLHKAFNKYVQGTAADQTKLAMIAAVDAGYDIRLQVHDELDGNFESPEAASFCARLMETCLELQCVSRVDPAVGPSWGEVE